MTARDNQAMLTNSLPFVVQYRRKDGGIHWVDMAAYDMQSVANNYRDKCVGANVPWEYRVDNRTPASRLAIREGQKP